MKVINNINELRDLVREWKKEGLTIGFVPTMGYLHEGHESLIKRASKENDKSIVSIFVNPTQFAPNEDLESYPRDLEKDKELCNRNNVDIIFNPTPEEMYCDDFVTFVNMNGLTEGLCGKSRPTHFRGVCTVVTKLFNIVKADRAYFGEKDAQQLAVIKRLVRDLNIDIEIIGCPIVREEDGLAKSSRNVYLSKDERAAAIVLNRALKEAHRLINNGERNSCIIKKIIEDIISNEELAKVDYVEVVDALNLKKVDIIERDTLIAIAVYIGKTRLIDNFTFKI
ncbi:pantoate--beta-alanine ligase [uncultured Clostridium sp.]|uniref:pantoate--beta-alanine ligase n=1 Tax=uncultured Clostridium sp. TaxID=59620 RepID=UPI00280BEAE3|nr:pantoate--beta-alanine ligase [uncultured Clostridium sp.]